MNLLRVLLAGHFGIAPSLVQTSADPHAARLLIGDPALACRRTLDPTWHVTDLAEAWFSWTGKPFVFAVWVLHPRCPSPELVARWLREVAASGLLARDEIASRTEDPQAAYNYLTRSIRFELGDDEKSGLCCFRDALLAQDLLPPPGRLPQFV